MCGHLSLLMIVAGYDFFERGRVDFQNESSALRELRAVQMAVERMVSWKKEHF